MLEIKQIMPVEGFYAIFWDGEKLNVQKVGCLALTEQEDVVALVDRGHGVFEPVTNVTTFHSLAEAQSKEDALELAAWRVGKKVRSFYVPGAEL